MFVQNQQPYYGMPNNGGYQFNGMNQPITKVNNVLTPEEIKQLQQSNSQFSLGLTQKEILQAKCNHRSADGLSDSLTFDRTTGIARCTICGYEFRPVDQNESYDSIKDAADRIVDILQTIKILYTDLPAEAAGEYFQIIPLIMKVPQLFEFAAKSFAKNEYNSWSYNNRNMGGVAMLQNLNNMFGFGNPYMQPNMMNQPYGGGYPQGQPQPNPAFNPGMVPPQQAPMGMNPFTGQPNMMNNNMSGYQPTTQGYQYQPNQNSAPVTPTVPQSQPNPAVANGTPETVTQKVTV